MASNAALDARDRGALLSRLATERYDVLVIGGGVTGAGTALDAASRGLRVALVEARDLASGTREPVEQAHSRRSALPGAVRLQAGLRGAAGTRPARVQARPAPGQAGLVPVPAVQEGGRAAVRGGGPGALRLDGGHAAAGTAAPAHVRARRAQARPGAVA